MSLLRRLLRRPAPRRLSGLDALTHARPGELVEVHGRIEAIATIAHPTTGEPCVALEYRAWPQSTTIGIAGASPEGSRAFQLTSRQAADFVLQGAGLRVLVRVEPGEDLIALHHALLADYGIGYVIESDVRDDIAAGRLVHILQEWTPDLAPLCLYYPSRKNQSAAFKALVAMARELGGSMPTRAS
ncbi:MAG TPA: LysR substrate-binding domain-containing protein [Nannocystaceae bacterium]|nr:LysR substrate-binding domain-containing protein [Nannocystaceae bacterium]